MKILVKFITFATEDLIISLQSHQAEFLLLELESTTHKIYIWMIPNFKGSFKT